MQIAFYIALMVISISLIVVVVLQARSAGMQNRDSSSVYRTRRGLEKTLYQTTVALATIFLLLALVVSLPLFGAAPATPGQVPGQPGIPGQPAPGQAPAQPAPAAPAPAPGGFVGDNAI